MKTPPEEAPEEEVWFLSFADLMSLLMGFWVIMFSFSNFDEVKFQEVSKGISEFFGGQSSQKNSNPQLVTAQEEQTTRQERAFQMLISMLHLGAEWQAMEKIESLYESQTTSQSLQQALQEDPALKSLRGKLTQTGGETSTQGVDVEIPLFEVFQRGTPQFQPSVSSSLETFALLARSKSDTMDLEIIVHCSEKTPYFNGVTTPWSMTTQYALFLAQKLIEMGLDSRQISVKGVGTSQPVVLESPLSLTGEWSPNERIIFSFHRKQNLESLSP